MFEFPLIWNFSKWEEILFSFWKYLEWGVMFSEKRTDIILPSLVLVSWYVSANLGQYHLGFEPKKIPLDLFTKVVTCIIFGFPWDKAFNTNRNEFIIYMLPFKLGVSKLFASFALIVSYHYMVMSDNILLCSSSQNLI